MTKVPVTYNSNTTYWSGRPTDLVVADPDDLQLDHLLVQLLGLCTPHGTEHHIADVIKARTYVGTEEAKLLLDKEKGNILVRVGSDDCESMFSCHMDIVGKNENQEAIKKGLVEHIFLMTPNPLDEKNWNKYGMLWGAKRVTDVKTKQRKFIPSTLGADDKVGVWICLKMIEKKIPGLYVFHTGEECGGIGSGYLSLKHKDLFKNIKRAVAFDRAGYTDIITFQRGGRCASIEFGEALASELNLWMPPKNKYVSGIRGTFTDTANYIDIIPECCNMSVGYFNQHGDGENLDWWFLNDTLLPAILKVEWDNLPTKRDPKEKEVTTYSRSYGNGNFSNTLRKTWKEATPQTSNWDFPEWDITMGHLPDEKEDIVRMAIGHYITNNSYNQKRDAFAQYIYDLNTMISMQVDECISKDSEIELLKQKLAEYDPKYKAMVEEKAKEPEQKIDTTEVEKSLNNLGLTKDETTYLVNRLTKPKESEQEVKAPDPEIVIKKQYLAGLNLLVGKLEFFGDLQYWANGYVKGATYWLKENEGRHHEGDFNKKEKKKLNRLIYAMACLCDMVPTNTEDQLLLDDIDKYIEEHVNEEGWVLNIQQVALQQMHLSRNMKKDEMVH